MTPHHRDSDHYLMVMGIEQGGMVPVFFYEEVFPMVFSAFELDFYVTWVFRNYENLNKYYNLDTICADTI